MVKEIDGSKLSYAYLVGNTVFGDESRYRHYTFIRSQDDAKQNVVMSCLAAAPDISERSYRFSGIPRGRRSKRDVLFVPAEQGDFIPEGSFQYFVAVLRTNSDGNSRKLLTVGCNRSEVDIEIRHNGARILGTNKYSYTVREVAKEDFVTEGKALIDSDIKIPGSILQLVPELSNYQREAEARASG